MPDSQNDARRNVEVVQRFLAAFERRWPQEDELAELLAPDAVFVERPNLFSPLGSERDATAMREALEKARELLAWQSYEIRDHIARDEVVVTRMRWSGELAQTAGPWPAGTRLAAWCVAHYKLADGRSVHIEHHDCYQQPTPLQ
jgi:ketosteroid isomerase-like protein